MSDYPQAGLDVTSVCCLILIENNLMKNHLQYLWFTENGTHSKIPISAYGGRDGLSEDMLVLSLAQSSLKLDYQDIFMYGWVKLSLDTIQKE